MSESPQAGRPNEVDRGLGPASGRSPAPHERGTLGSGTDGGRSVQPSPTTPRRTDPGLRQLPVSNAELIGPLNPTAARRRGCSRPLHTAIITRPSVQVTVKLCGFALDAFNAGPGRVDQAPRAIEHMLTHLTPLPFLLFDFSPQDRNLPSPSWAYRANFESSYRTLALNPPPVNLQIGFIQTVELLEYAITYGGLAANQRQPPRVLRITDKRDASSEDASSPWYGAPGTPVQPQTLLVLPQRASGSPAPDVEIQDRPQVDLPLWEGPNHTIPLRSIVGRAVFWIWLAVKDEAAPAEVNNIEFLYFGRIESNRTWNFTKVEADQVSSELNWACSGTQRVTLEGPGRGPRTPVLSGVTANVAFHAERNRVFP